MRRLSVLVLSVLLSATLLLSGFFPHVAAGADLEWKDAKGPGYGDALALEYDPVHNILYRGTSTRGVWKYQGGAWVDTGGPSTGYSVFSLAYDSTRNVLYAGTSRGVWRCTSPDSAPVWASTYGGVNNKSVYTLAYDSARNLLYAGTSNSGVWRCASPDTAPVWVSTGGGINTYEIGDLAYDSNRNLLYAATTSDTWRCSSPDSLPAWTNIGGFAGGTKIVSLAYDSTRNLLYAGPAALTKLWRCASPDSLPAWTDMGSYPGAPPGFDMAPLEYDSARNIIYIGTAQGVGRCKNPDSETPLKENIAGALTGYKIEALALDPSSNVLYAGTAANGAWQCNNPDTLTPPTWTRVGQVISAEIVYSLAYDATRDILYAGTASQGVWRCVGPGSSNSWTALGGTTVGSAEIDALAYDATRNILYAGTYGNGVYRCVNPDTSPTWTSIGGSYYIASLLYDPVNDYLYRGTWAAQGVYRLKSPATSASWTDIGVNFRYEVHSLAYDSARNILYAGTYGNGVWRTANPNGSYSWKKTTGTGTGGISAASITSLAYDAARNVLYAGAGWGDTAVWRCTSPNGTIPVTWTNTGGAVTDFQIASLTCDSDSNVVYAGTMGLNGVWKCENASGGPSWSNTGGAVSDYRINSLAYHPTGGLNAGSYGQGVWCARAAGGLPRITSCAPTSGTQGQTLDVNIVGSNTNFASGTSVATFSGTGITVNSTTVSDNTHAVANITIAGDAAPGARDVNVITGAETPIPLAGGFTVQSAGNPVPSISSINPSSKTAGDPAFTLAVNGTNFVSGSKVRWNGSDRTTTYVSGAQLTAAIPSADIATPGTAAVTVFNPTPGGGTSNSVTFTINPVPGQPYVTSITPKSGTAGATVSITSLKGINFEAGATVRLEKGTVVANATDVVVVSSTEITCKIVLPTTAGTYDVVVKNENGKEGRLVGGFTVAQPCGCGTATMAVGLGLMMGLMSLAGTALRRRPL